MRQLRDVPAAAAAAPPGADPAPESPTLALLAAAEAGERKVIRVAVAAAVVVHLLVMLVPLPEVAAGEPAEADKARVVVVQTPRFKPPEIPPEREIPERRAVRVPVPDPTPNELEPLRTLEVATREIELPDVVLVGELPPPPPEEPSGPIEIGGAVNRPIPIDTPQPIYSEIARRARLQGVVILRTIIDKEGRVSIVRVEKDLPFGLTDAATDAVARWRYRPATLNSKPVAVYMDVTVNFRLQ